MEKDLVAYDRFMQENPNWQPDPIEMALCQEAYEETFIKRLLNK